jgi:hypothetical protein
VSPLRVGCHSIKGANKKVWWKRAKRGHVWEARINARTIYGQGCPKCAKAAKKVRERSATARRGRRNPQLAHGVGPVSAPTAPQIDLFEDDLPF